MALSVLWGMADREGARSILSSSPLIHARHLFRCRDMAPLEDIYPRPQASSYLIAGCQGFKHDQLALVAFALNASYSVSYDLRLPCHC